ncbi:hypothetical protein FGO68_gene5119 [Halteria grandinella]|uniref:Uncharacterized protein n=1 Tax=Halteria grandinella TaxID=5974 RepID=A0A8J8NDR0_HALGN|nr:hypothetical protein FGO68_gene5119 [Halteria grandinella]
MSKHLIFLTLRGIQEQIDQNLIIRRVNPYAFIVFPSLKSQRNSNQVFKINSKSYNQVQNVRALTKLLFIANTRPQYFLSRSQMY